ncbi:GNAT family N-acetyltransferase [Rudaeicoccus suwonensis]|uniref:GNAT family N-acetyltransferase n=1 Tax=Rudaeicoccus suwonensis TaxID=657409 RepID=UPI0014775580|nr:GNAT family N-acetyltransferase [Rudaeicoccus suwonensis]
MIASSTGPVFVDDVIMGTGSLRLRALDEADAEAVAEGCADAETLRWLPLPTPYPRDLAAEWIRDDVPLQRTSGRGIVRAIEYDGAFCGVIDLKKTNWRALTTEIGFWVMPAARGQGLAGRASRLLSDWAMEMAGIERVEIRSATGNFGSQRSAVAAGFTQEGVLRSAGIVHGGRVDLVVFGRTRDDV